MKKIVVSGSFDNIKSCDVRFLEEASKFGPVFVLLWSDEIVRQLKGANPQFPQEERFYYLNSIRYTDSVKLIDDISTVDTIPLVEEIRPDFLIIKENDQTLHKKQFCASKGRELKIIHNKDLIGFPELPSGNGNPSNRRKVLVTGSFDWFHSGHVRFFEETSALGELYVVVGHDENIRLLKGEGHPFHSQDERSYMAQSIRFVKQTLISSGHGWMDAEPEISKIKPDIYAVNEDGDRSEKRIFCRNNGIEYLVLDRKPKAGLPHRESTILRGF